MRPGGRWGLLGAFRPVNDQVTARVRAGRNLPRIFPIRFCSFAPTGSEAGTPPVTRPEAPPRALQRAEESRGKAAGLGGRPGEAWAAWERAGWAAFGYRGLAFGYRGSASGYRGPASTARSAPARHPPGAYPAPFGSPKRALLYGTGGGGVGPAGGEVGGWVTGRGRRYPKAAPKPAPGPYPRRAREGGGQPEGGFPGPLRPPGGAGGRFRPSPRKMCRTEVGLCGSESLFQNPHTKYFFGNPKRTPELAKPGWRPKWGPRVHEEAEA